MTIHGRVDACRWCCPSPAGQCISQQVRGLRAEIHAVRDDFCYRAGRRQQVRCLCSIKTLELFVIQIHLYAILTLLFVSSMLLWKFQSMHGQAAEEAKTALGIGTMKYANILAGVITR
jgi:hypothetical protein